MRIFANTDYNFIRWRWHALVLSAVVIVAGLVLMAVRGGLPLGIDFSGGTLVVVEFAEPVSEDQVRSAVAGIPGEKVVQQYGDAAERRILVRLPQTAAVEEGDNLEQGAVQITQALGAADLPAFEVISTDIVGPVIGADLQRRGVYATIAALLAIAVYIGFRFRFSFAVGALAATFHDVVITVAVLSFFGYELSLNVVAALLTITGYSVNDTIVIFDRVRENLRAMRREPLEFVVNRSVNQTLARTVITSGTTCAAVLALFLFGGEVLRPFAFTMLVGVIAGTYSTVFIASSIAIIMTDRKKRAAAATAASPAAAAATRPPRKPGRARAS